MNKGYQVIEPEGLDDLFANPKYFDFAVAVFYWLIHQLYIELGDQLAAAQIEVIKVVHHSLDNKYPALGIHYGDSTVTPDLEPLVIATINRLLEETSIIELISFIGASETDWKTAVTLLVTDGKNTH